VEYIITNSECSVDPIRFVERHGVLLEGGRGPRPNLAEAVVGERVRGSWWFDRFGSYRRIKWRLTFVA